MAAGRGRVVAAAGCSPSADPTLLSQGQAAQQRCLGSGNVNWTKLAVQEGTKEQRVMEGGGEKSVVIAL